MSSDFNAMTDSVNRLMSAHAKISIPAEAKGLMQEFKQISEDYRRYMREEIASMSKQRLSYGEWTDAIAYGVMTQEGGYYHFPCSPVLAEDSRQESAPGLSLDAKTDSLALELGPEKPVRIVAPPMPWFEFDEARL